MKKKIARGQPLEELVKGSLEYTLEQIRTAFYRQFLSDEAADWWGWIVETFNNHAIVKARELAVDEFYYVPYQREGEGYTFAARDQWEVVELAYRPQTLQEARNQKFTEQIQSSQIELLEAEAGKPRRLKAIGITAWVINGNGRRYPAPVVRAAVNELRTHLHESAGQGRALQLLGEAEHPSDKPTRRANLLETVVRWDAVDFDGQQVLIEGTLLPTAKGKDIQALLEGGVIPDVSQRAYGNAVTVKENGAVIDEVVELHITGYDLVLEGSDPQAGITMFESQKPADEEANAMELTLEELKQRYPEMVAQILAEHDAKKRQEMEESLRRKAQEEDAKRKLLAEHDREVRALLGVDDTADLTEALRKQAEEMRKLQEAAQARQVAEYLEKQCAEIKYPEFLKQQFTEAVKAAGAKNEAQAKQVLIEKRREYDAIMAGLELQARGFGGMQVLGPVFEQETGLPAFARPAWMIQESLVNAGQGRAWDSRQPQTLNERFAAEYLRVYDRQYKEQLLHEAKRFEEAETTADLSLPYSVMRAVIAEAFPELVATSIFDFGMMGDSTARIYYEAYSGETGYTVAVTNEAVTAVAIGSWAALAQQRVTPGTVVVTNNAGGTTYTEGTDYVIDYANGKLAILSGGITAGDALKVTYSYTAIRKGEMAAIERGKMQLTYKVISAEADRLATQLSREAVLFSRSQLGYDAVTRVLSGLVRQVRRKIDQGILYRGLTAALSVASNSGGTWNSSSGTLDDLVKYLGLAKVKVANRYYEPTGIVLSKTNGDRLSNWDGFKRDGFPDAVLNSNGFIGRVKGLPVFETTEFSDAYIMVVNRELVMHRVYQTMQLMGPFPTYDVSGGTSKLIAADQYYAEEFNATEAPVPEKGALVVIQ